MRLLPPRDFGGVFRTDDAARGVYAEAAGIGQVWPAAVAVPSDVDDVAAIVRWAHDNGIGLVPRGSGSGMAGGAIGAGVVLDLSRLRGIAEPDAGSRSIRAGVGILRGEVSRYAARAGLRFPVDPSSGEFCTIGGMASTNAAGPHSLRHGPMRPWVLAIDCVFDDGTRATVRRGEPPPEDIAAVHRFFQTVHPVLLDEAITSHTTVIKDSSGYAIERYAQTYDLIDLLVGSEGTLAVFTALELALTPEAGAITTLVVAFQDLGRAVEAAVASREHGAAACELLDRTFLELAARAGQPLPIAANAEALLLVEVEGADSGAARADADRLRDLFRTLGGEDVMVSLGPGHDVDLWTFRQSASPAIARMHPSLKSLQFIEDSAVPPQSLAAYVRGVRAILERAGVTGVIFGHAGDAHVHVNPLVDVSQPDWRERVERILEDVTELVHRLGGTLTGEHGDGRLRTPLIDRVWSAKAVERFALIKRSFDPANILNPGVKVPLPGQTAIGAVKYDPLLPELPATARNALKEVERERAYSRFRLDML
ncbi:MAG TPA: FAD-binding oxidoreductase [Gemmatimonadaceae bacterium]|nr:FAD-binding oxidoreductase [Gemmatimonadaceae bacterium]